MVAHNLAAAIALHARWNVEAREGATDTTAVGALALVTNSITVRSVGRQGANASLVKSAGTSAMSRLAFMWL